MHRANSAGKPVSSHSEMLDIFKHTRSS